MGYRMLRVSAWAGYFSQWAGHGSKGESTANPSASTSAHHLNDEWIVTRFQYSSLGQPHDLRKGLFTGPVLLFKSRKADRLKLIYWDASGLVIADKRLEETEGRVDQHGSKCRRW